MVMMTSSSKIHNVVVTHSGDSGADDDDDDEEDGDVENLINFNVKANKHNRIRELRKRKGNNGNASVLGWFVCDFFLTGN